jgi:hypothetical protein
MTCRILIAWMLLGLCSPALGEVYRCEADGVIEFSDRPCNGEAVRHNVVRGISLVPADEDLASIAEANRRYIEALRERRATRRQAAAAASRADQSAEVGQQPVQAVLIPFRNHRHGRLTPVADPTPVKEPNPRYSALNGPILGTRNRERWEPSTRIDQRRQ